MAHIPSAATDEIEILSFEAALRGSGIGFLGGGTYDSAKWLYVPDFYTEYRYILGTRGSKPLIAVGINPSTAAPDELDNTLKSVERIAQGNGYDSFIMFNVYAQRATDPRNLERDFNESLHRENMAAFEYILKLSHRPAIWAAWGTIIKARPFLWRCMSDMVRIGKAYDAEWYVCGARSKRGGHPHHPLYLRKDAPLCRFDAEEYLSSNAGIAL